MSKPRVLPSTREPDGWDPSVPLPRGLTIAHLKKARAYLQRELNDLVEVYEEQANVFSGLVGIYGARALDAFSPYEKHRHKDLAQQRFPDLRHKTAGAKPPPSLSLESKGSKRPWELQSHLVFVHPRIELRSGKPTPKEG